MIGIEIDHQIRCVYKRVNNPTYNTPNPNVTIQENQMEREIHLFITQAKISTFAIESEYWLWNRPSSAFWNRIKQMTYPDEEWD